MHCLSEKVLIAVKPAREPGSVPGAQTERPGVA
jgi:hypothetical protein